MTDGDMHTKDDELLSALLDDALPAAEAERLRRRLAAEPALARRLEELQGVDAALRATWGDVAGEPIPQRTLDLLQPQVLRPAPSTAPRWFGVPTAVTSALALAAGFALAFLLLPRGETPGPPALFVAGGTIDSGSALYEVLETLPSNESRAIETAWTATPRLTFRDLDGDPCRRVDVTGATGSLETLACRRDGVWEVDLVAFGPAGTPGPDGVYRPATGGAPSRIDDAIGARIDGAPLGRDEERDWIARDWSDPDGD